MLSSEFFIIYISPGFAFPMEAIENGNLIGSTNGNILGGAGLVSGKKGLALHTNGAGQHVDFGYQADTCLGYFLMYIHGWITAMWMQSRNPTRLQVVMDTARYGDPGVVIYVNNNDLYAYYLAPAVGVGTSMRCLSQAGSMFSLHGSNAMVSKYTLMEKWKERILSNILLSLHRRLASHGLHAQY